MPANVEIKARVRDFAGLSLRAAALSAGPATVIPQIDTFFPTDKGRLKLRELGDHDAQLIYYERPDQNGPKRSDYSIFETHEGSELKAVLTQALGIRGTVEKVRHLYLVGQTRVHLDDVKGLGYFVELEVVLQPDQTDEQGRLIAESLISELGIDRNDLMDGAYMDLLEHTS